jgi:NAD(P)-dependent dehydrogenase (short-subunit alcohol dehydrogenase family)
VTGVARSTEPSCDVTDPAHVDALFERTGPVDLLVNNAAVIHEPARLWEVPLAEWRRLLEINVVGTVAVLRRYLPSMNARGRGVVLNVSSTWGRSTAPLQAPYCATKFAVEGLSRSLASEVAPGVVVMAVNPGVVATDMLATAFGGDPSAGTSPEDCARSFLRMLRAVDASWNGRSVDVDAF